MLYNVTNRNNQPVTTKILWIKDLDHLLQMLHGFWQNFFICNLLFIFITYSFKPILTYFIKKTYNICNKSQNPRNHWGKLLQIIANRHVTSYNFCNKSLFTGGI